MIESGVMPGDIITELEGNDIADFESFQPFLTAIGRPVRITFFRRAVAAKPASTLSSLLPTSSSSSSSASASSSSQPSSSSSSVVSDLYKSFSSSFSGANNNNNNNTNNNTTSSATSNLSEEEKQARRDMLSKAANDRNWEKQAQAKRAARKQQVSLYIDSCMYVLYVCMYVRVRYFVLHSRILFELYRKLPYIHMCYVSVHSACKASPVIVCMYVCRRRRRLGLP